MISGFMWLWLKSILDAIFICEACSAAENAVHSGECCMCAVETLYRNNSICWLGLFCLKCIWSLMFTYLLLSQCSELCWKCVTKVLNDCFINLALPSDFLILPVCMHLLWYDGIYLPIVRTSWWIDLLCNI